jgi:hypothetical protein
MKVLQKNQYFLKKIENLFDIIIKHLFTKILKSLPILI